MRSEGRHRRIWAWVATACMLGVVVSIFATGAYSAAITLTTQPLQNSGTDGKITESSDWNSASSVVTRHESSDLTLNVSDQITSVSIQGTKASGAADVTVELKDSGAVVLDSGTLALPSATGAYDTAVTLSGGTTKYSKVATVLATYTLGAAPCSLCLYPHSEDVLISGTSYYDLLKGTAFDGTAITETTTAFNAIAVGRRLMENSAASTRKAKHVYSLSGVDQIDATTWTGYYRGRTTRDAGFGDGTNARLSMDAIVRKSDGTVRTTLATNVAQADVTTPGTWQTLSGTYAHSAYTVLDTTDYLEIDYYGQSYGGEPASGPSYIELRVDDGALTVGNQTRIDGASFTNLPAGNVRRFLKVTDGWDEKNQKLLSTDGKLYIIETSDNDWLWHENGFWHSAQFDNTAVPGTATIVSVKLYIEHYEESGFQPGTGVLLEVGGGSLSSPTMLASTNPPKLNGEGNEGLFEWDVTATINTPALVNDLKSKITVNSSNGKKLALDYIYVVVEYIP